MSRQILTDLDFNNASRIINLPDATAAQEPATYAQLQAAIEGLAFKDSAVVATQGNINLSSPGATVDGVTMVAGDRVLVRAQTSAPENGIYIWNGSATPMTRSADASTSNELESAVVTVDDGTDAGTTFRQTNINFVLDTNDVTWVSFGTAAPAASETTPGIAEIATQAETDAGTDDARIITPLKLATWSGRKLKVAQDIGDGSATQFTITHNFNTRDLKATVRRNSGNYDEVIVDIDYLTVNTVRITFDAAPTTNAFRVIVIG